MVVKLISLFLFNLFMWLQGHFKWHTWLACISVEQHWPNRFLQHNKIRAGKSNPSSKWGRLLSLASQAQRVIRKDTDILAELKADFHQTSLNLPLVTRVLYTINWFFYESFEFCMSSAITTLVSSVITNYRSSNIFRANTWKHFTAFQLLFLFFILWLPTWGNGLGLRLPLRGHRKSKLDTINKLSSWCLMIHHS